MDHSFSPELVASLDKPNIPKQLYILTKPKITLMALIVALGAYMLSAMPKDFVHGVSFLLGLALLVSGSSALNMYLEREHDKNMLRTKNRPLPNNKLDKNLALKFSIIISLVSLPIIYLASNCLTLLLGVFSLYLYVLVYTPMKRWSSWSVIIGGVPGAMPALMGYTACTNKLDLIGLSLFSIAFLWQLPHVIAIGVFREKEYTDAGFWVIPRVVGLRNSRILIFLTTILLFLSSLSLYFLNIGSIFYLAVCLIIGAWFLAVCAQGFKIDLKNKVLNFAWARKVFIDSLIYQTILFLSLVIDVGGRALFA